MTVNLGSSAQEIKITNASYTPQGGSAGVAIIDAEGTASFAMPKSNTNVMALYGPVTYIDENGMEQTVSDYTVLTGDMSLSDFVNGSWFVVASKLSLEIPTAFSGDAHLILADGAEMTLKKSSGNLLVDNANLSIYGQDAGTGKLTIEVSANETNVGGSVAINGGVVEVSCKNDDGVCSGIAGNVTLNWTRNTNRVKADTYGNSNVTVAEGKFFVDDENKAYSGKLSEEQIAFIAGKVLKPTIPVKYIDADGSEQTLYDYTVLTGCLNTLEEPKKCEETKLASGQWYVVDGNVRYEGELSSAGSIHLVLKDGAKLTVDDDVYVSGEDGLTAEINIYGQSGGMGELIAKSLADYSGNIIFNGGKATINEGIKVAGKYTMNGGEVTANCAIAKQDVMLLGFGIVGSFITINGGILNSTSCVSDDSGGKLFVAIVGEAAVEINGGTVNLAASSYGISGSSVSINGGNVSIKNAKNGVSGVNVSIMAYLDRTRVPVSIDIGFGDVIYPDRVKMEFPVLLDMEVPEIYAYSIYSVISEKFEAIVFLGDANSRYKDFYDIYILADRYELDGAELKEAIRETFEHRRTGFDDIFAFKDDFIESEIHQSRWKSFLKKKRALVNAELGDVGDLLRALLLPIVESINSDTKYAANWDHESRSWK